MVVETVNGVSKGATDKVQSTTSGILSSIEGFGNWLAAKGKGLLDSIFPPEKRNAFLAKLQAFMLKNPKLSAFLGMNLALTGIPLFLFALFSLSVFLFALIVGLVLGLLAAIGFTLFMVGTALVIVLPTVFFTTASATFLFLWGLGGYYILKWANSDGEDSRKSSDGKASEGGPSIGDRLNWISGGRLTGFMDAAKKEESKKDIKGWGDQYTPASTMGADAAQKKIDQTAGGVQKNVDKAVSSTPAGGTLGTVRGGVSGVTGLG